MKCLNRGLLLSGEEVGLFQGGVVDPVPEDAILSLGPHGFAEEPNKCMTKKQLQALVDMYVCVCVQGVPESTKAPRVTDAPRASQCDVKPGMGSSGFCLPACSYCFCNAIGAGGRAQPASL